MNLMSAALQKLEGVTEDEDFVKPDKPLTDIQSLWAHAYVGEARFNATKAARLAGYAPDTCSERGRLNKNNPTIRAYCDALIRAQRILTKDEVLARLTEHANASLGSFIKKDGTLDLRSKKARQNMHLLHRVEVKEAVDLEGNPVVTTKISIHDSQAALDKLARAHGAYQDRVEHSGNVGLSVNAGIFKDLSDDELERAIIEAEADSGEVLGIADTPRLGDGEVQA